MEKPKSIVACFQLRDNWSHATEGYIAFEMDAFLAFVAGELKRALDCWGDASAEVILEETIKDLTGKKKKEAGN